MKGAVRVTFTAVLAAAFLAAAMPMSAAGSQMHPEIMDGEGDVSPAIVATNMTLSATNASALYQNATAYDVVKAWVAHETMSDFWIVVQVRDLPDGWSATGGQVPVESPFGDNFTHVGTSLVANFTIAGQLYHAAARLAMPSAGQLFDNYTVWGATGAGQVTGMYNTTEDWVAMKLDKSLFAGLADGTRMTNFWVQGRFMNHSMDYAPDASDAASGVTDPLALLGLVQSGALVTPNYGTEYRFGQYYHPPSTSPPPSDWPPRPDVQLSVLDGMEQEIEAGEDAVYQMRIVNRAMVEDTIYLTLNSAREGWSHELSETQLTLPAGEGALVDLRVSSSSAAEDWMTSIVSASSELGASENINVKTLIKEGMQDDGSGEGSGDGGASPVLSTQAKDAPGFELVVFAAAAVGGLILVRRRK